MFLIRLERKSETLAGLADPECRNLEILLGSDYLEEQEIRELT